MFPKHFKFWETICATVVFKKPEQFVTEVWEVTSIHLPITSKLAPGEGGNEKFIHTRNSLFSFHHFSRSIYPSFCDVNTPMGRQKSTSSQKWDSYMHKNERKMFCNRHDLYQLEIASKIMTRVLWEPFWLFLCFFASASILPRFGVNDLFQDLHARDGSGKKSMQSPPFLPTGAEANKLALHTHFMRNCAINRKTLMHHN